MANETTFNTRLKLKYDTYANWTTANPKLLEGEIAVVVVPAQAGAVVQEPAILFKVGDGTSLFNTLSFAGGLAADVHDWAKAATKPEYQASEIAGLADYISGKVQDTNTKYKIEKDAENGRKFTLSYQELGGQWTVQDTIEIPETVYTLAEGTADGTVKFNGNDVKVHGLGTAAYKDAGAFDEAGAAAQALQNAKTYADGKVYDDTTLAGRVSANETAIEKLNGSKTTEGSVAYQIAQIVADADANYDTLKEIADWIGTHTGDAATMNSNITNNTTAINELKTIVGDTAVATQIANAIEPLATKEALKAVSDGLGALAAKDKVAETDLDTELAAKLNGKVNSADCGNIISHDAEEFAAAGHVHDISALTQESGYIIFNCGSATTVI